MRPGEPATKLVSWSSASEATTRSDMPRLFRSSYCVFWNSAPPSSAGAMLPLSTILPGSRSIWMRTLAE